MGLTNTQPLTAPHDPILRTYSSSQALLDDVEPFLLPHKEWESNIILGLNYAHAAGAVNVQDRFAVCFVQDAPQLACFAFYSKPALLHVALCVDISDIIHLETQAALLAQFLLEPEQAGLLAVCDIISGPTDITKPVVNILCSLAEQRIVPTAKIQQKVGRIIRGSYVDADSFVRLTPRPDCLASCTIRKATPGDDVEAISRLVMAFIRHPPMIREPISMEQLRLDVVDRLNTGSYYLYLLSDGRTIAAVGQRHRSTPNGISITMIVTAEEHRNKGIATALTSYLIEDAVRTTQEGGLGKKHVAIFWVQGDDAERVYRKMGFVEGYQRVDYMVKFP